MGLIDRISGTRLYFDTNIFIYALEGFPDYADDIKELFSAVDSSKLSAVTSELTLAETLVKPFVDSDLQRQEMYRNVLKNSEALTVVPVSREILIESARLRSVSSLRLPDAIHLSTALAAGCSSFVTNDRKIREVAGISVVMLDSPDFRP
jgi:predicted nucleic acid-binding protein